MRKRGEWEDEGGCGEKGEDGSRVEGYEIMTFFRFADPTRQQNRDKSKIQVEYKGDKNLKKSVQCPQNENRRAYQAVMHRTRRLQQRSKTSH